MKVDAQVVSKDLPDWMNGRIFELRGITEDQMLMPKYDDEPLRYVVFLSQNPTLIWPRWWHRFGKTIGWTWLAHFRSFP